MYSNTVITHNRFSPSYSVDTMNRASIEKVTWQDVRVDVARVNPELAKIIDELDPGKEYALYRAKYPYGSKIVEEGKFYLPDSEGQLKSILNNEISNDLKSNLDFLGTGIPAGIVLSNSFEVFIQHTDRILPWVLYTPGTFFGLWRDLEPFPSFHPFEIFHITAGARNLFMVPNIGDISFHRNLRRDFNIRLPPPKDLLDHWQIFTAITQDSNAKCKWNTELIFFSKKWIDSLKNAKSWKEFRLHLLDYSWQNTAYWRNKVFYDFVFSCVQASRNLKPNPYLADTTRHLLMIGIGAVTGFCAATDNIAAPVDLLQNIYIESYGLRKYVPTILHPARFSIEQNKSIYYSLQFPTTLEFSPKSRKLSSTLDDLRELKHILEVFLHEIRSGKFRINNTALAKLIEIIRFDFFHSKLDPHAEISLTNIMSQEDSNLIYCPFKLSQNKFAETGTFVRGCVRITKNKVN